MVEIAIEYEGQLRCRAQHGPSGSELFTDAPADNHGRAESFSPTDLVATALGSCMVTVMGIAARTLGVNIDGARVKVEKQMTAVPVRRIAVLVVNVYVPGEGISDTQRRALEKAAYTCPVKESLHADTRLDISFHWQ